MLGIENLVSAMAASVLDALEPLRDVLPGVNAGSLVSAVVPQEIVDAPPGVTTSVEGTRAVLTLACYVLACVALSLWASHRRDVTGASLLRGRRRWKGQDGDMLRPPDLTAGLVGVDMARCLALLGMMATHILPGYEGLEIPWPQQLAGGRASALFAVLAGVSLSLTGREHPVHGRERIARSTAWRFEAPLIALLGMYLATLDTNVAIILTYYGLLFLRVVARPRLSGPVRTCVDGWCSRQSSVICSGLAPRRDAGSPTIERLGDPGAAHRLSFTGTYPMFPWLAYLLAGMAIGRRPHVLERAAAAGGRCPASTAWLVSRLITNTDTVDTALRTTLEPGLEVTRPGTRSSHGLFGTTPTESWLADGRRPAHHPVRPGADDRQRHGRDRSVPAREPTGAPTHGGALRRWRHDTHALLAAHLDAHARGLASRATERGRRPTCGTCRWSWALAPRSRWRAGASRWSTSSASSDGHCSGNGSALGQPTTGSRRCDACKISGLCARPAHRS